METPDERIIEDDDDDGESHFTGNSFNRTLGGSIHIPLFREIKLSKKFYSRIYGGVSYYQTAYKLKGGYSLTSNFFNIQPQNSNIFSTSEKPTFDHTRISLDGVWRFFLGEYIVFDLNGGYTRQNGIMNFKNSELEEGWAWSNETINIVEEELKPFYGARIGLGRKIQGRRAIHFSVGVLFYEVGHTNVTDYLISESDTDFPIDFNSEGEWIHRINVGISASF